jgi:hypothetical protein
MEFISYLRRVCGFSPGIPVSSTNKTDRRYIAEIFIAPGVRHHTPCLFHVIIINSLKFA